MRERRTRLLLEIALTIALATVLSMLTIWRMPQGGSVSLGMLPLFVLAFRRGLVPGLVAGALYGLVDLMVNPYVVHWAQLILDYPLAYLLGGARRRRLCQTQNVERAAARRDGSSLLWRPASRSERSAATWLMSSPV
jgi:energy-coupled thiamine transporter ThiT